MNIRTRHMALLVYGGLAGIVLAKDLVTDPVQIIALIAPIAGMFTWDKIKGTPGTPEATP
jgi:hypothetical protein